MKKFIKGLHSQPIWHTHIRRDGNEDPLREVCSVVYRITGYDKSFRLVLERMPRNSPQRNLDLEDHADDTEFEVATTSAAPSPPIDGI